MTVNKEYDVAELMAKLCVRNCPKCGHIDKVKVFSTSLSDAIGVPPKSNDD